MLVALVEGVVSSFIVASCGTTNRKRQFAYMAIGVAKRTWARV
ncbi:hypothetical protein [Zooshikella ganghwensis]|nr:hypothetical protein [Zooshikella ganghwensis]